MLYLTEMLDVMRNTPIFGPHPAGGSPETASDRNAGAQPTWTYFQCLAVTGPHQAVSQIESLCQKWLQPEVHTKEQMLQLLVLEQFLGVLPPKLQMWVRQKQPRDGHEAGTLVANLIHACEKTDCPTLKSAPEAKEGTKEAVVDSLPSAESQDMVTLSDMMVDFSADEWYSLSAEQRSLYWDVTQENYQNLASLGDQLLKPDLILKLEEELSRRLEEDREARELQETSGTNPETQELSPEPSPPFMEASPPETGMDMRAPEDHAKEPSSGPPSECQQYRLQQPLSSATPDLPGPWTPSLLKDRPGRNLRRSSSSHGRREPSEGQLRGRAVCQTRQLSRPQKTHPEEKTPRCSKRRQLLRLVGARKKKPRLTGPHQTEAGKNPPGCSNGQQPLRSVGSRKKKPHFTGTYKTKTDAGKNPPGYSNRRQPLHSVGSRKKKPLPTGPQKTSSEENPSGCNNGGQPLHSMGPRKKKPLPTGPQKAYAGKNPSGCSNGGQPLGPEGSHTKKLRLTGRQKTSLEENSRRCSHEAQPLLSVESYTKKLYLTGLKKTLAGETPPGCSDSRKPFGAVAIHRQEADLTGHQDTLPRAKMAGCSNQGQLLGPVQTPGREPYLAEAQKLCSGETPPGFSHEEQLLKPVGTHNQQPQLAGPQNVHTKEKPPGCDDSRPPPEPMETDSQEPNLSSHQNTCSGEKPPGSSDARQPLGPSMTHEAARTHPTQSPRPKTYCVRYLGKDPRTAIWEGGWRCCDCGRGFQRKSHLCQHYRTHAQQRPFQCQLCRRCFSWPSYLTQHYQLHSRETAAAASDPSRRPCLWGTRFPHKGVSLECLLPRLEGLPPVPLPSGLL